MTSPMLNGTGHVHRYDLDETHELFHRKPPNSDQENILICDKRTGEELCCLDRKAFSALRSVLNPFLSTDAVSSTRQLAINFVSRAQALELKGKKRDDAAIDYFVGAMNAASLLGRADLYAHLARTTQLIIAVRGYASVEELAK